MRLLLSFEAALLFLCCCSVSTWAFSLSSLWNSEQNQEMHLHPLSPPERESRSKRQAYEVYAEGDVPATVDKSGKKESGPWGPWTPDQACSRTCGGGVQSEKRQCSGDCTGSSIRYISCNLEACPGNTDFRAEQCSQHNDDPLDSNYHKWKPYKGKNKCELVCAPETGSFYFKWADKVVDGTKCDSKSNDICVDGECVPVGCDGKIGSNLKLDKCGKCDGDGSTCKTIEGTFDEKSLAPGYHDIIKLPEGATNIIIKESKKSTNTLALKNSSDHFYLNGNGLIQVEKDVDVAGTVFVYEEDPESLVAQGPLTEDISVSLLIRKGARDSKISYEFSIPLEEEVAYLYKFDNWTPCSVTCGKGEQTRNIYCVDGKTKGRVEDDLCEENNATKPEFEKSCETVDCAAEWYQGEWEPCSSTCGDQGQQYRVVYCHQVFSNGKRVTVDDGNCTIERPPVKQTCNRFACPEWQAGPWSACSEKCGDAYQYRSVTCRSEKEGEEGKLLAAEACPAEEKATFETERTCNLGPCEGLTFITGEWNLCTKCNDTEETREVTCKDTQGRAYPLEKCLVDNSTEIPVDTRSCATQPPCTYEWTVSEWSKCSTECGHGHKTRRVICAIHQNNGLEVVDESHCQAEKPEGKTNCTNEEKCTGTWYTSSWTPCTAECGGGDQERVAVCLNYDKKPVPEWCDEAEKPKEKQECNVDACPTCFDSEFGCCPDNSTFATGEFNFGCSNCSTTEFGCCADNVTISTGLNSLGCEEFVEAPLELLASEAPETEGEATEAPADIEGSAAESILESGENQLCNVTSADGEEASVECTTILPNLSNSTEEVLLEEAENATIHCSKTDFGCCPDWFTPATGKGNEGCEKFVLGSCNATQFGCCHDEVTLARGPNLEGCGEPSCAASLYGCCKDRKTIAFGAHYAGCERSSFPCELSEHGCCPDGETAALGKNGTGCGENCLTTKFGCCPDGKTTSKGAHNEGCGCEFSQYGCCPDGKSVAKGVGFYGCPESCAQSQFGCCPDGKTRARGSNKEGCPCQYTRYGCCPDGETTALGPKNDGCDNCRYAKHGCCTDNLTKALGPNYAGCPTTTVAPFLMGGTVAPRKIAACNQTQEMGTVCGSGYRLAWHYNNEKGECSQFWYGGCGGNENNFPTKDMCDTVCVEPPGIGRCYLPKVDGSCKDLIPRYYYDSNLKQCKAFWWKGCLGNANNFGSWEECSTFCKNVGPIEEEPLLTEAPRQPQQQQPQVYYPATPEPQISIESDPRNLEQQRQPQPQQRPQTMEDICRSRQDAGQCETYSDQYFYNAFSKKCEMFTYGGCGGNRNRFSTRDECEQRCFFVHGGTPTAQQQQQQQQPQQPQIQPYQVQQPAQQPAQQQQQYPSGYSIVSPPQVQQQPAARALSKSRDNCLLNVDGGTKNCNGAFSMWYYELATGQCTSFKYTGCGGNGNRFSTKEACENLCTGPAQSDNSASSSALLSLSGAQEAGANSICSEAKDTGPCQDFATKWWFNKADGTCNRFHYGGCQGTNNRFDSEVQCKAACQNFADRCTLPKVEGPCSGKHTYYFFNPSTQNCETFIYGGCLGNTNRFATLAECQTSCPKKNGEEGLVKTNEVTKDVSNEFIVSEVVEEENTPAPAFSLRKSFVHDFNSISERSVNYPSPNANQHIDCFAVPDPGSCGDYRLYWHYSAESNRCRQFYYGGCAGNTNRFEHEEDCENACISTPSRLNPNEDVRIMNPIEELEEIEEDVGHVVNIDSQALPELCMLPEQKGSCYDKILRWRYDSEKSECRSFMYSGCDANANHFTSQETCERSCGKWRNIQVCELEKSIGNCQLAIPKWYYDKQNGECRMMMWTGCGGNGNSFSSKADCETLCREELSWSHHASKSEVQNFCELSRSSGPCTDSISMWYFDKSVGDCLQFTYGGCRGNQNRFVTKSQCQQKCAQGGAPKNKEEICRMPFETGPCRLAGMQRYFYDPLTQTCQLFHYGGCEGNENRFETELDCYRLCSSVKSEPTSQQQIAQLSDSTTPVIYLIDRSTIFTGNTFRIRCNSYGILPITWYKNGGLLQFGSRITEENDDTLEFVDALTSDAGIYSCIAGEDSRMSEGVEVVIKRGLTTTSTTVRRRITTAMRPIITTTTTTTTTTVPPMIINANINSGTRSGHATSACFDTGNAGTCSLIVKNGLCSRKRYSDHCCRTCKQSSSSSRK